MKIHTIPGTYEENKTFVIVSTDYIRDKNVFLVFYSDMVIVNTACSSDDNGFYTNVQDDKRIDKRTCKRHESKNPLSGECEVYSNVAKDHPSDKKTCKLRKITENDLYISVEEDHRIDKETCKQLESRESPRPCESEVYSNVIEEFRNDKNPYRQEKLAENELYTELEEDERINKETHNKQEGENPLYESATGEVEFNPIYN